MNRIIIYVFLLIASVQCFAQNETKNQPTSNSVVTFPDTIIEGIKFRRYNYEFNSSQFSKDIFFTLPLPEDDAVMRKIRDDLLAGGYDSETLEQRMEEEIAAYKENYAQTKQEPTAEDEIYEEYNEMSWHITPIFIDGGYIAFVSYFSEYMSGALHHMWGETAAVYSLSTGMRITQDDVLDDIGAHRYLVARKLYSLLQAYLKEEEDVENVNVMGMLNDNFYFTKKELIYMYVPYEVAYYAAGEPTLSIPKKWLKPYLNVDGPLYKYWFGK